MERHTEYENCIKLFLENKLSSNQIRKFIFHLDDCKMCKDMLIDEYVFNVIFNDKDNNISSSYTDNLYNLIENMKERILKKDKSITIQYVILSIAIILILSVIFSLLLSIILKL